jgi:hypothetical protein
METSKVADDAIDDIEVTPEMTDAGVGALYGFDRRFYTDEEIVSAIFRAMIVASLYRYPRRRRPGAPTEGSRVRKGVPRQDHRHDGRPTTACQADEEACPRRRGDNPGG